MVSLTQSPGVGYAGQISERLTEISLANQAANNLATLCFGQLGRHDHLAWAKGGAQNCDHRGADGNRIRLLDLLVPTAAGL